MKLGGNGVLPFRLGGGKAPHELAYEALKSAVGIGGSSPDGTIVEAWRWAKARALAAIFMDRRASLQAFPHTATSGIVSFEQRMMIALSADAEEQERRAAVTRAWVDTASAVHEELLASLQAIDLRFNLVFQNYTAMRDSGPARAFEDWDPSDPLASGPAYATGLSGTQFPNYSDEFVSRVVLDVGGTPSPFDLRQMRLGIDLLKRALPAWIDFAVFTEADGFILDQDLLDVTAFGH